MKPTLKKLWNGELAPWSEPESTAIEFRHIAAKVEKERDLIEKKLDEEGQQLLENFEKYHCEWMSLEIENSFLKGFSLGMKMAAEAFLMD